MEGDSMKLTQKAQQSADFAKACYLQGLCTIKEYLKAIKSIYTDNLKEQIDFLQENGLTEKQAIEQIYGFREEQIL